MLTSTLWERHGYEPHFVNETLRCTRVKYIPQGHMVYQIQSKDLNPDHFTSLPTLLTPCFVFFLAFIHSVVLTTFSTKYFNYML